ncbi:hypothetical protein BZG35_08495 [Brevundimonas sp. LM2]|nr:hypothetical protein BZG35_08495 [Brevundimonas sp. LM2]
MGPAASHGWGLVFAADPGQSALEQTVIWRPEWDPRVVILGPVAAGDSAVLPPSSRWPVVTDLLLSSLGWHGDVILQGVRHRLFAPATPGRAAPLWTEPSVPRLPPDALARGRAAATLALIEALGPDPGGPPGRSPPDRPVRGGGPGTDGRRVRAPRRHRLALSVRALDARADGASYRDLARGLFGADRIAEAAWKTESLRDQTIRLVRTGRALSRGGFQTLLGAPADI